MKLLYTVEEAAELLSISRTRMYELLSDNSIGSVSIGRSRRISADALRRFVAEREGEPDGSPTAA